jgi:cytoskeletal protein CcmA (bactofilin family)
MKLKLSVDGTIPHKSRAKTSFSEIELRSEESLLQASFLTREGVMFRVMRGGTVIGSGLKIVGNVSAEGLVEVNGQIEGDVHCTSLVVSPNAQIVGSVAAERVVVNGRVEGPIQGGDVVLKSKAHVVGDIRHQSLTIEKGAHFDGRASQAQGADGRQPERTTGRTLREAHEPDAAAG